MKIKRLILSALCGAMCFVGSTAFAQEHNIVADGETMQITISGTIGNDSSVKEVSVNVLKPGKTAEDLNQALIIFMQDGTDTFSDVLEYSRQFPVDADGSYDIVIPVSDNGIYKVYVDYEGNADTAGTDVRIVKATDVLFAIDALIGAAQAEDAIKILKDSELMLGFKNALYKSVNQTEVAKKFFGIEQEEPIEKTDEEKRQKAEAIFEKACIMQAIAEGKASISENLTLFGIKEGSTLSDYNQTDSKNLKNEIASNMKSLTYSNLESYQNALQTATILAVVRYPDGVGDVQDVIKEYSSVIGIVGTPSKNANVYNKLAGNQYETLNELLSAYKDAVKKQNNATQGGGGSSGGSSGGYSGASAGSTVIPAVTAKPIENLAVFSDIGQAEWAREAIVSLYQKGIVSGMDENRFCPQEPLTREQFVTMLVQAFGFSEKEGSMEFEDVKESDWYYTYIKTAFTNGIVNGTGDGKFGAGSALTRQDMAVMLMNTINKVGSLTDTEKPAFTDVDEIAPYALDAVNALKNAGILNGMGDGCFKPNDINTRPQAAVVIYSVLDLLK